MVEKTLFPDWLASRMDIAAGQKAIFASEENQKSTAQDLAVVLGCSVTSAQKFGDRLAIGYRITSNLADQEFWIWGADRPMNQAEIEAYLRRQIEANLAAC